MAPTPIQQNESAYQSRPVTRSTRSQTRGLCARCANINFNAVFSKPHRTYRGNLVKRLGPIARWRVDSCSLCRLLATTLPPSLRQQPEGKYSLRSSSSKRAPQMGWKSIETFTLRLEGPGTGHSSAFHVTQPEDQCAVRVLKESCIDFKILTNWLRLCQEMHTKTCTTEVSSLSFLKLIDCENRTIVPALDRQYVALSYVWGSASGSVEYSETLPGELPATIQDALTATQRLGLRYLWIDRYCINQRDKEEVSRHVHTMDLIYKNSEVTIIAAAGQDPSYGLPGVGRRHRAGQSCANIGTHVLVSALEDPRSLIKKSTWITRAWTYQEALLSRRRLVFTDQQVYYECYGMYCCEALNFPIQDLHKKNLQSFRKRYCNGQNIGMFPKGVGNAPWEVVRRIEEYSKKSLTNPSDILRGMMGIFRAFKTRLESTRHCWGTPIFDAPVRRENGTRVIHGSLASGLLAGMCWDLKSPSVRRPGFPSWSWTGWFGSVQWGDLMGGSEIHKWWKDTEEWTPFQAYLEIEIFFEACDKRRLDFNTFLQSYDTMDQHTELSNFIHISAWTTPIQILRENQSGRRGSIESEARIDLEDGGYLRWRFHPTTTEKLGSLLRPCFVVHLVPGSREGEFGPTGPAVIVVCRVQAEDRMERVGFGWIDQCMYRRYGPDGVWEFARGDSPPPLFLNPMHAQRPRLVRSWRHIRLG